MLNFRKVHKFTLVQLEIHCGDEVLSKFKDKTEVVLPFTDDQVQLVGLEWAMNYMGRWSTTLKYGEHYHLDLYSYGKDKEEGGICKLRKYMERDLESDEDEYEEVYVGGWGPRDPEKDYIVRKKDLWEWFTLATFSITNIVDGDGSMRARWNGPCPYEGPDEDETKPTKFGPEVRKQDWSGQGFQLPFIFTFNTNPDAQDAVLGAIEKVCETIDKQQK
jgi:hypothetical protein